MGDDLKWKRRLPTRIYNYNYKVSEGYYKPQTDYFETKQQFHSTDDDRNVALQHQSYAERYAKNPWYGGTQGLPYSDENAAGPLIKLGDRHMRSSSLLREMREHENEGVPLNIRASRRKKRFELEEEQLGIRPRLARVNSSDSSHPKEFHQQIKQKIQNLDNELLKSKRTASTLEIPSKWNYELDRPGRKVQYKEKNYISPSLGTYGKRSTYQSEFSHSSKPPFVPFRNRKSSSGDEPSSPSPRIRVNSVGDFVGLPRNSHHTSTSETELDEPLTYLNRAPKIREARRMREAKDFSEDINKLVDKMRVKKLEIDPQSAYSYNRSSRSSSYDRALGRRGSLNSRCVFGTAGKH